MRKRLLAWGPLMLLILAAAPAGAQDVKIGYVNFAVVLEQAPQSQVVTEKLRQEFAPRQRDLVAMQTELQQKQQTYERDSSVMGEAERGALERELRDGARELQRADTELQEDFNIRRNEELSTLQRTLVQQVQEFARDEEYDLIVTDVVYVDQALDITSAVLASMQSGSN
jgi:outer membrane protein